MGERIRQTPHVGGNFSTLVSIYLSEENRSELSIFTHPATEHLENLTGRSSRPVSGDQYHVSLSRHGFLKPHMIDAFIDRLRERTSSTKKSVFYLLPQLECYVNESQNTAFVGVPVDLEISPNCLTLISLVDSVMTEFGLETYYKPNPRPHVSLAFSTQQEGEIFSIPTSSPYALQVSDLSDFRVDVDFITLSIGKSFYKFPLSYFKFAVFSRSSIKGC